jgi:integration host factor subunit beta
VNKADLIDALRKENGLSRDQSERIVNTVFNEMTKSLAEGGRVEIRGFCSFYVKEYKAYIGRNPKTKEAVSVAPKKLPFFKCGKELKERVDR